MTNKGARVYFWEKLRDIAKKLKVSPKTIQRDIAAMNDYIHVAWIGSMKNGHWEISAK